MRKAWFKKYGWVYYPISWQGWALTILTLLFCGQVFVAVDSRSHSVSDTLYGVFPFVVSALVILGWIASNTADKSNKLQ
ncbi:MAG: hypothetical protein RBG1_1C00001G0762 [candidate division Zixibacteria bacterium RBG-1]|nr:MAG: hypothetical protein RBG1_1C00001G0762 [candidate division Zixibacteria bacterium RBG-1]OGC86391.1 MAG: hypothetical protein A2V73_02740 [candidate division Zixibacteria bacterium RBG_19FT_COMBO_42_43]